VASAPDTGGYRIREQEGDGLQFRQFRQFRIPNFIGSRRYRQNWLRYTYHRPFTRNSSPFAMPVSLVAVQVNRICRHMF
jgi:hypothetical protein